MTEGVNGVILSGSVSTSVTSKVNHNKREAVSTLKLTYRNKEVTLENRQLTPIWQQALAEGSSDCQQNPKFTACQQAVYLAIE